MDKLFIRVDMNNIIATGHVMRCMAIADAAKDMGICSVFILADNQAESFITSKGYETIILGTMWNDLNNEIPQMLSLIEKEKINNLLVDTYQATEEYLNSISMVTNVCYIDDLGLMECNIDKLVCYSHFYNDLNFHERYNNALESGKINHIPLMALGIDYVPLRKCFENLSAKKVKEKPSKLLIMTGGADQFNAINRILSSISIENYENIWAICGRYSQYYDELTEKYAGTNVDILYSVDNIHELMQKADIAISAGGTTIYELCACGTPSIIYTLADNQVKNAKRFDEKNIMSYTGDIRYDSFEADITNLLDYYSQYEVRLDKSIHMKIDGCGAKRIVEFIYQSS